MANRTAHVRDVRRAKELKKRGQTMLVGGIVLAIAGLVTTLKMELPWVVFGAFAVFGAATSALGFILTKRAEYKLTQLED